MKFTPASLSVQEIAGHLILIVNRSTSTPGQYNNTRVKFHKRLSLSHIIPKSEYKLEAMISYQQDQ
jgi:hypothetical protein